MNKKIYVKASYGNKFIKEFLPDFFIKKLYKESQKEEYKNIFNYIKSSYNISEKDIFKTLYKNLIFNTYNKDMIISSNDNVFVKDRNKLCQMISLIDYGNLEIKGTSLINDTIDWLNSKMPYLYLWYLHKQSKEKEKKERS